MARNYFRFLNWFTCFASTAMTAGTTYAGGTDFDTVSAGNLDGCDQAEVEINVTAAPSADTTIQVFIEATDQAGTGYTAPKLAGNVQAVASVTDKYSVYIGVPTAKGRISLKTVDANLTASAQMRGIYPSDS